MLKLEKSSKYLSESSPLVSAVIAVYNDENYVHSALRSILDQTYKNIEIIVVNDGSQQTTTDTLIHFAEADERIRLFEQENHGLAYSLNKGIEMATGRYIARMDSDDWSYPERFQKQVQFLESNKDCVAVGSLAEIIDMDGNFVHVRQVPLSREQTRNVLPNKTPFIHPSVMFRRESAVSAGLYPLVPISQDLFFFNKLASVGQFANIDIPLIKYRVHPKSLSRKSQKSIKLVHRCLAYFLANGVCNDAHIEELKASLKKDRSAKNLSYHGFLARKFLNENYQPAQARSHALKAIAINKDLLVNLMLLWITFLPEAIIQRIWHNKKGRG